MKDSSLLNLTKNTRFSKHALYILFIFVYKNVQGEEKQLTILSFYSFIVPDSRDWHENCTLAIYHTVSSTHFPLST